MEIKKIILSKQGKRGKECIGLDKIIDKIKEKVGPIYSLVTNNKNI